MSPCIRDGNQAAEDGQQAMLKNESAGQNLAGKSLLCKILVMLLQDIKGRCVNTENYFLLRITDLTERCLG